MSILFVFVLPAANSLSSGEVEAIIISSSILLVGVVVIMIILSIFGFVFKKQQLRSISSVHTSSAGTGQQTSMFYCAQSDEVNFYAE